MSNDLNNNGDPANELKKHVSSVNKKSDSKTADKQKETKNKRSTKVSEPDEFELQQPEPVEPETIEEVGKFNVEYDTKVKKYGSRTPNDISDSDRLDNEEAEFTKKELNDYLIINLPSKNNIREEDGKVETNGNAEIDKESMNWAIRVADSSNYNAINKDIGTENLYKETLERDTEWGQYYETPEKDKLGLNSAGFDLATNGLLKGPQAMSQVRAMLGLGNMVRVPLWHSGLWLTLNTPSEAEVVDLYRILATEKITLGRQTHGLAFSNLSGVTTDTLMNFALNHVELSSIKIPHDRVQKDVLRELILVQDIPIVIWGVACTMFPRGFEYTRQCIAKDGCHRSIQEMLDVRRLLFVDRNSLTKEQLAHMSKSRSASSVSIDEVKAYQASVERLQPTEFKIVADAINRRGSCDMYVTFKSPSVKSFVDSTNRWVDSIQNMANKASTFDNDNEREAYMNGQVRATKARQYTHWIKSIKYINKLDDSDELFESYVEDVNDIEQLASDVFSLETDIVEKITKEVIEYINSSTISIIGIPSYECPICKKVQEAEVKLPRFVNFIPLDVIMLFFRLLVRRNAFLRFR